MHELVRRLLVCEAGREEPSGTNIPTAFRVGDRLRLPLTKLAGVTAFHSLAARALIHAKTQAPILGAVQIKPDGSLEGWGNLGSQKHVTEAEIMLIAQLLKMLARFIGEKILLNLLHDIWPDFSGPDNSSMEKKQS